MGTFLAVLLLISAIMAAGQPNQAAAATKYTYYVHKTAGLYSSTKSNKRKLAAISINVKLTTYSSKSSTMYKVNYAGKTGYVYKSNLSTEATAVTQYVSKNTGLYTSTSSKKKKILAIPAGTKLITYSPLSNTMYKVSYKGKSGYVYKSSLTAYKYTFKFGEKARVGDLEVTVSAPANRNPYYAYGDNYSGIKIVVGFKVTVKNVGKNEHYISGFDFTLYANNVHKDDYTGEISIGGNLYPGKTLVGKLYYVAPANSSLSLIFDDYQYDKNDNKLKAISFVGKN